MTDVDAAVRDVHRVTTMPYGLARTQAAEQVLRRLESGGPASVVPYALGTLVDSMFWAGEAEKSFVPFTRMLRLWDEHREHFDDYDRHALFWMFKWMVADLMEFPAVPAAQIEATIEDMARRYTLEGLGMNAVMHQRFLWAAELGDDERTDAAFEAWCATPRDDFSQCESCEPGDRASYLQLRGRHTEVVTIIENSLAQSPRCATEPADMLSVLQLAYLALGNDTDAARTHRRAIAELAQATGEMASVRGRLIEFCARSGNDDAALRRLTDDQQLLFACETPRARLGFLLSVGTATHLITSGGGGARVVPVTLPGGAATTTVAELDAWMHAQATELAAAFDARNGTSAASLRVTRAWSAERTGHVVDLAVLHLPEATPDDAQDAAAPGAATSPGTSPEEAADASPSGSGHPDGDGQPDTDEEAHLAAAEEAVSDGDLETASEHFLEASRIAEAAGRLADAGWALANAARCAWRAADAEGATAAFARALELLDAAGAPPTRVVQVLADHAQCAAESHSPEVALAAVERASAALDALDAPPGGSRGDDADGPDVDPALAERDRQAQLRARWELTDLRARLLATTGDPTAAAPLAQAAAEGFASMGAFADAAHAFWLAGRVHRDLGDLPAAAWHLESAVEGFEFCGERGLRAEAAGELIAVLRADGRQDEADAVAG